MINRLIEIKMDQVHNGSGHPATKTFFVEELYTQAQGFPLIKNTNTKVSTIRYLHFGVIFAAICWF